MTERFHRNRASALRWNCLLALALAGCSDDGADFDVSSQIGPDPVLPEPSTELLPDLKVAEVVGWQEGETPTVPEGLTVTAYAKDLVNPRTVHTLAERRRARRAVARAGGQAAAAAQGRDPRLDHVDGARAAAADRRRKATSSRCCATPTATGRWTSAATC